MSRKTLNLGEKFGDCTVERQLGVGGLGTVWLARHQVLDTLFAVKILDPGVAEETPEAVYIIALFVYGRV